MAFPTFLINSATGSDTAASGAGPSTALTGSSASTNVAGTLVTLDGSPDLSGVATDGSHALWFNNTTSGAVTFTKITAVDNSAKTVTVSPALSASTSGITWAIGGKRASMLSSSSRKLLERTGSNIGDLLAGWTVELESGHTESSGGSETIRAVGNLTDGRIIIKGTYGAATKPLITFTNNGQAFILRSQYLTVQDIEFRNTNATKTASVLFTRSLNGDTQLNRVKCSHSSDRFWKCAVFGGGTNNKVIECHIGHLASNAIEMADTNKFVTRGNYIHDCVGIGISCTGSIYGGYIDRNIIDTMGSQGIYLSQTGGSLRSIANITRNTIYNCTSDGIRIATYDDSIQGQQIMRNILANNGGYGLNFSNGSVTRAYLEGAGVTVDYNDTYGNTSGGCNISGLMTNDPGLDPQFVDAPNGNFEVGENMKESGSLGAFPGGLTYSYDDIGAAQREEPAGGGGSGGGSLIDGVLVS